MVNTSNTIEVELNYERYMKGYRIVHDYNELGPGTIFSGDSGYINEYDDLIERLKDDIKYFFLCNEMDNDINKIQFVNTSGYLETFVKGLALSFY